MKARTLIVLALVAGALASPTSYEQSSLQAENLLGLGSTSSTTTCEGSTQTITCSSGVISIVSALYGRQADASVCSSTAVSNQNCGSNKAFAIMQGKCQGKTSCSVSASNGVFGDPCSGTYKYLKTTYQCVTSGSLTQENTCEGSSKTITCSSGTVISLAAAVYGRNADSGTCYHSATSDQNCATGTTLITAQNSCNGQTTCTLSSSNSVFGDPCGGTYKYLLTSYKCVSSTSSEITYNTFACEGNTLTVTCANSGTIGIVSANYGRDDSSTCTHSAMSNTNCYAATSYSVVNTACSGKTTCSVAATNSVFGDPCVGTYKYLRVAYTCTAVSPSTTPSLSPSITPSITPSASPKPSCYNSTLITSTYPAWQYDTSNCGAVAHGGSCTVKCYLSTDTATATATCNAGTFSLTYPSCSSTAYSWGLHKSDMTCGTTTNGASTSWTSWQSCVEAASKNCASPYITWVSSTRTCQTFNYMDCQSPTAESGSYIFKFTGTAPGFTPSLTGWTRTVTLLADNNAVANTNVLLEQRTRTSQTLFTYTVSDSNCYDSIATGRTWGWRIYGTPASGSKSSYLDTKLLSRGTTTFQVNAVNLTDSGGSYTFKIAPVTWALTDDTSTATPTFGTTSSGCNTTISATTTDSSGTC